MYLKSLELQGFKSFPDKTVIEFNQGLTAIVGANGSGKSNISDAVRWVLGEMSAKSLRGSKMEDVIFNGSSRRRPASFAEVIMTIDNSDSLMKIDYDEVSVGRRLYRTGESEYYINHKQVRLKDIVDLFLNTGIGREGYSVISQGKIAEIISLKGNERRELFEEAAGISRFRYRKSEATQKLQNVNDNAVRIGDILSEVEARLPRLETQSAKAREYLALAGEKKNLELGIWSARVERLADLLTRGKEDYTATEKTINTLQEEIEKSDRLLDDYYIKTQENTLQSETIRAEISALASLDSDVSSSLSVLENEIHHMDQKRAEWESMDEKESDYQKELEQEKEARQARVLETQSERDLVDREVAENRAKQNAIATDYLAVVDKEEELLQQKDALAEKGRALTLEQKECAGYAAAAAARKNELSAHLAEAKNSVPTERLRELTEKQSMAKEKQEEEEKNNGAINLSLYRLGEAVDEKRDVCQKARMEKMDAEQRRDTLLRMERLLEGFSDSVKEIMNATDTLSGICGPVSRLIHTEEEKVLAIETALGSGVQHIVVESETDAKRAIDYLKKNRLGRATFLPLDGLRVSLYNDSALQGENGYLGLACDLCDCDKKYRKALEFLLGKTLVCRDLETASRLAKQERYAARFVTLDGQVIHAGGSFTGGQAQRTTGVLSRSGDLSALQTTIENAEKKITSIEKELDDLERQRIDQRSRLKESDEALQSLRLATMQAENDLALEKERMLAYESDTRRLQSEMEQIDASILQKESRAAEIQNELESIARDEEELDRLLHEIQTSKGTMEKEREGLIVQSGEIFARREKANLLLEQEKARLAETETALQRLAQGDLEKKTALENLAKERDEAVWKIQEGTKQREDLARAMEEKKMRVGALSEDIRRFGEESAAIRLEQKEKQGKKENLLQEFSRLSSRLTGAAKERDSILHALMEEYELTPDSEEFIAAKGVDTNALGGEKRLGELRGAIRRIGPVSLESIQELAEAKERYAFLSHQFNDITKSKKELENLISDLERTMREMFSETFEQIRYTFRQIFSELFGGGSADIELTDKEDLLNCGVEIRVQPPGKVIKNLSLLSGGEQAFVAIALYMSLLRINPSPFCIFDEIESALDEANVRRFAEYIKKHNDKTQFIVITHRRGTMEAADILYGITMQEKGVSDFIRLDAEESARFASIEKGN